MSYCSVENLHTLEAVDVLLPRLAAHEPKHTNTSPNWARTTRGNEEDGWEGLLVLPKQHAFVVPKSNGRISNAVERVLLVAADFKLTPFSTTLFLFSDHRRGNRQGEQAVPPNTGGPSVSPSGENHGHCLPPGGRDVGPRAVRAGVSRAIGE